MAIRAERFFWVEVRGVNRIVHKQLAHAHQALIHIWDRCPIFLHDCTPFPTSNRWIWMFRLKSNHDYSSVAAFEALLQNHRNVLVFDFCLDQKQMGVVSSPLMPLVRAPGSPGYLDGYVGLHSANDSRNGTLVMQPGPRDTKTLDHWRKIVCVCCQPGCESCGGFGCFRCYRWDCSACMGSGWKDFAEWSRNEYRIDCSSGVALLPPVVHCEATG